MRNNRLTAILVAVAIAGFSTPWLVPQNWMSYILEISIGLAFIWGVLCASSAKGGNLPPGVGAASWLVIGTDRPGEKITDNLALKLFWITLLYLTAFGIGAFSAI